MEQGKTRGVVRELRVKLGMTQEEFAHALGITVSTVNRWENGHSEPSKLARASIVGLAEKRGVSLDPDNLTVNTGRPPAPGYEAYAR